MALINLLETWLSKRLRPKQALSKAISRPEKGEEKERHEAPFLEPKTRRKTREIKKTRLYQGDLLICLEFPSYIKVKSWTLKAFQLCLMLVMHAMIS